MDKKNPLLADLKELFQKNDDLKRKQIAELLQHLVSETYVNRIYGFEINEIDARIRERTMIGFKLGFLGTWLPEWQFVDEPDAEPGVSPLALEVWSEWGPYDERYFAEVMATYTLENLPNVGDRTTYGELVRQGINPLQNDQVRDLFDTHGSYTK